MDELEQPKGLQTPAEVVLPEIRPVPHRRLGRGSRYNYLAAGLLSFLTLAQTPGIAQAAESHPVLPGNEPVLAIRDPKPPNPEAPLTPKGYDVVPLHFVNSAARGNIEKLEHEGIIFSGFNIKYNREAMSEGLRPNEVLMLTIYDDRADEVLNGHKQILTRSVVLPKNPVDGVGGQDFNLSEYFMLGLGDKHPKYEPEAAIQELAGGLQPYPIRLEINKYRYETQEDPPSLQNQANNLIETKTKGRPHLIQRVASVPLRLASNFECAGVKETIVSGVRLPVAYQTRVCRWLADVGGIVPDNYKIIIDGVRTAGEYRPMMSKELNQLPFIKLLVPSEKLKQGHDIAFGTALHEAVHTAFFALDVNDPVSLKVEKAYNIIKASLRQPMPTTGMAREKYDGAETDPVWAILTEQTYEERFLGVKNSISGASWQNPTEMASSTVDVMATFPNEFKYLFSRLDNRQKPAVKAAVVASLSLIINAGGNIALQDLVPRYPDILLSLGIDTKEILGN